VLDRAALAHLAVGIPGVYWVDQVQQFSDLFGHFRQQSALYVFASYALLLVLLGFRYGISGALQILWPVLVATLTVLALAGITGTPFNLFSVLALILVAGMGIDYGIFLRESAVVPAETLLAVIMSALTTLLAFGLLALSKTTAISSFGWVIVTGISVVLACAVLTLPSTTQQAGQE
jgi:predicted exporter